jgi:hypothetical protein
MGWFKQADKKDERNAFCSFCRKNYREVGPLVEGPGNVFICTACVHLCSDIIQQQQDRRQGKIRPFLIAGATYRFITETGTWTGVVRTRLPHPNDHWIQVDPITANDSAVSEPTWINLLHVHTVTEIASAEAAAQGGGPSGAPATTDFRVINKSRRDFE